jgi:nitroreductase
LPYEARFLINIIEASIANAINRGHNVVEEADCVDAVRQHSLYLVSDFGYEIRDVSGFPQDILYALVGAPKLITKDEAHSMFMRIGVEAKDLEKLFYLMLWYGVFGIAVGTGDSRFIYDYDYDFKRLDAEVRNAEGGALYVINDGLHVAMAY